MLINPSILLPKKHILLLSHMRSNSSLIGHLLGNHDSVNGYYEMHMGYFSWKSLIKQKIDFHRSHKGQKPSKYYFDKILHNEHYVSPSILSKYNVIPILSLRNPLDTIPSIIKLYSSVDKNHPFFTEHGAINYYDDRLNTLLAIADMIKGKFYYIDSDAIKIKTELTLNYITDILHLPTPLQPTYQTNINTGKNSLGDNSDNIKKGEIVVSSNNYSEFLWENPNDKERMVNKYNEARDKIIKLSKSSLI